MVASGSLNGLPPLLPPRPPLKVCLASKSLLRTWENLKQTCEGMGVQPARYLPQETHVCVRWVRGALLKSSQDVLCSALHLPRALVVSSGYVRAPLEHGAAIAIANVVKA